MKVIYGGADRIDRDEALRYLGYMRGTAPSDEVEAELAACEGEVLSSCRLAAVYAHFSVTRGERLDMGFASTDSRDIEKYLSGCGGLVLFAATAGAGIDRLIAKYARLSPSRAAIVQALGSALAEQWCNQVHARIRGEYAALSARFSPGYGDFPLAIQRDVFAALHVTKNIGVTLSEELFMTPSKSVTAIVGIKDDVQR